MRSTHFCVLLAAMVTIGLPFVPSDFKALVKGGSPADCPRFGKCLHSAWYSEGNRCYVEIEANVLASVAEADLPGEIEKCERGQ